eukprot:scaffold1402_cov254-Pinguiococcus_pyrenoidosus.AAC.38
MRSGPTEDASASALPSSSSLQVGVLDGIFRRLLKAWSFSVRGSDDIEMQMTSVQRDTMRMDATGEKGDEELLQRIVAILDTEASIAHKSKESSEGEGQGKQSRRRTKKSRRRKSRRRKLRRRKKEGI